jgi:hypothetical protein
VQANANAKFLSIGEAIPHIARNHAIENGDFDRTPGKDKADLELKTAQGRAQNSRLNGRRQGDRRIEHSHARE